MSGKLFYIEEEGEEEARVLIYHIHQDVVDEMRPTVEAGIAMHKAYWDLMADAGKGQSIPIDPIVESEAGQALLDVLETSDGIMAGQALKDLRKMQSSAQLHAPRQVGHMIVQLAQAAFTIRLHASFEDFPGSDAKAVEDAVLWALNASFMVDHVHQETGALKEFVVFND